MNLLRSRSLREMLLRTLQDLRSELARYTWVRLVVILHLLRKRQMCWARRRHSSVLNRRQLGCLGRCLASVHHGLDLFQAHHLLRRSSSGKLSLDLAARSRLLLRLQTPDICTSFQLGDVLGVVVALVASPGGLGRERNRGLLLRGWLASLVQHLLLVNRGGNFRCLTSKVKVLADALLRGRILAKRVVVEGIIGFVELVA